MIEAKDKEQLSSSCIECTTLLRLSGGICAQNRQTRSTSAEKVRPQQIHDERQRKKVCDRLSYRIVEVKAGIRLTDKDEEYALELPADVDPVTMVGNDREELLPVEEPSSDTKRAARTRRKPSRGAN